MITIVLWVIILLSVLYVLRFVWTAFSDQAESDQLAPVEESPQQTIADIRAIYRERLQQIENQRAAGELTEDTFHNLKTELDRQLLLDGESVAKAANPHQLLPNTKAGLWPVSILVALVLLASVAYYYNQWRAESQAWLQVKSATKDWVAAGIANDYFPTTATTTDQDTYQAYLRGLHALVLSEGGQNPDTIKLLANSYAEVGLFDMAEPLYKQLLALPGQETDEHSLAYVNAMMMANGGKMNQVSARRLEKLFRREGGPTPEVLYLLGLGAFNSGNYEIAVASWQPVLTVYPKDSLAYQELLALYNQANQALSASAKPAPSSAPSDLRIPVRLELGESIGEQTLGDSLAGLLLSTVALSEQPLQLVVYARTPDMPMPVAVVRYPITSATQWPMSMTLSDQDALMPERLLRDQQRIIIGARVATTADMRAQSGDFQFEEVELSIADSALSSPIVLTLANVID